MTLLPIEQVGFVVKERVIVVGRADAGGMRRIVAETPVHQRIDLTFGAKRQSVILLETGHVVLTALTVEQIEALMAD